MKEGALKRAGTGTRPYRSHTPSSAGKRRLAYDEGVPVSSFIIHHSAFIIFLILSLTSVATFPNRSSHFFASISS